MRLKKRPQNACLAVPPRQLPFFAKRSQSRWWKGAPVAFLSARDRGFQVIDVVARVFTVNLTLAALAVATILLPSRTMDIAALSVGMALVAWLLIVFARGPRPT